MTEVIVEVQLRWFGFLKRLRSDNLKILLELKTNGTKRKGKPKERWMDGWMKTKLVQQRPHIRRCRRWIVAEKFP